MSKDTSLISMHPFFQRFVFSVVQTMREKNFEREDKIIVDADLVPKVSEKVMMASMGTNIIAQAPPATKTEKSTGLVKKDMSELIAPIESHVKNTIRSDMRQSIDIRNAAPIKPATIPQKPKPMPQVQHARPKPAPVVAPRRMAPAVAPITAPRRMAPAVAPITAPTPVASSGALDNEKYGKIAPLLNDPSISTIECLGKNKELMIVRTGQKQRTRISLSSDDIKEILDKVADEAHVPLIEGVFRANVAGFSISAVVSEMVGSRFVIKKATAYGLLE